MAGLLLFIYQLLKRLSECEGANEISLSGYAGSRDNAGGAYLVL